jgi:hypothetical protein
MERMKATNAPPNQGLRASNFNACNSRKTCWIEEETKEFHALIFDT